MPYGDALKGAASDALKKCASLLGIALDLYSNGHEYVPEPVTPEPKPEPAKEPTPDKAKRKARITQKQKDFILKLIKSHVFTQDERDKAIEFANNTDTTKEKAIRFIESLQSHIEIRKKAEKELAPETDLQKVMRLRTEDPENFEKAWKDFQIAFNSETATQPEHFTHILRVYNAQGSVATA